MFLHCLHCAGAASPDVTVRELTEDWEFIVLACDGIWDVMTNQVRIVCHCTNSFYGSFPRYLCAG